MDFYFLIIIFMNLLSSGFLANNDYSIGLGFPRTEVLVHNSNFYYDQITTKPNFVINISNTINNGDKFKNGIMLNGLPDENILMDYRIVAANIIFQHDQSKLIVYIYEQTNFFQDILTRKNDLSTNHELNSNPMEAFAKSNGLDLRAAYQTPQDKGKYGTSAIFKLMMTVGKGTNKKKIYVNKLQLAVEEKSKSSLSANKLK
ncbi:uncharacterized protein LOC142325726 isoform X2 [Lycorma delicatula]|uniref:uncharacterized protein LOC142325726 isoform X2 n=1 Tax=Lycorma delicatula TaxID=130591 RepID=UPI003F5114B9